MRRIQISLDDTVYESLKTRALTDGISMSELIRRKLAHGIAKDPVTDARAYFDRLRPLESFASSAAATYVRGIRSSSRLLRDTDKR